MFTNDPEFLGSIPVEGEPVGFSDASFAEEQHHKS
jgi:hypothetical protein